MGMTGKKANKSFISEEDVSLLLQRYNPTVVLTLLHEVFQVAGPKIDWNALVKRTATGITSAREYQMLWRHLAYCHTMEEKLEDGAEPLDDDSDLEFELEVPHGANDEALTEAAACIKALISSSLPRESGLTNRATVGAPLSSIANDQTSRIPPEKQQIPRRGNNVSVLVPGQKHQLPRVQSAEGLDGNGATGADLPSKKKRKLWTKEEDMELIAAVQKFGEGNWANIVKGEFKHNRTASQLSQRWAIIRKRDGNLLAASGSKSAGSIMQTEERLATQKAISLALGNPKSGRIATMLSGTAQSLTQASSLATSTALVDTVPGSGPQSLTHLPQTSAQGASQKLTMNQMNKARTTTQSQLVQVTPSLGSNPSIKAAAFAAGGRIATPSTAASLFKAAQSKNVVYITTGTSSQSTDAAGNTHIIQPATSVVTPVSVSAPGSLRNGTTQGLSGKPAIAAENSSSLTAQRVSLESSSNPTLSTFVSSDMDDLIFAEVKDSHELEFDDFVAQGNRTLVPQVNPGADGKSVSDNSSNGDKQTVLLSPGNGDRDEGIKLIQADSEAFEKKSMGIISDKDQTADTGGLSEPNRITSADGVEISGHIVAQEQIGAGEEIQDNNKLGKVQVDKE